MHKILRTRFHEAFSYESETMKGTDIESLHNMRVSCRRLHAVMIIFRDCFPKRKFERHRRKIRSLLRSLGRVREYDVFLGMLELHRNILKSEDRKAIELIIARQKHERIKEREALLKSLHTSRTENYEKKFMQLLNDCLPIRS